MKRLPTWLTLGVLILTSACSWSGWRGYAAAPPTTLEPYARPGESAAPIARFAFDDLGSLDTDALETHAVPWKVLVGALLLDARAGGERLPLRPDAVRGVFQRHGFVYADTLLNWSGAPYPGRLRDPVGILRGTAHRGFPRVELELGNFGCAACHAGVTYDAHGTPRAAVWLGLPNTSLDLDGYVATVFRALLRVSADPAPLLAALDTLYPAMSRDERRTIERHVVPRLVKELPELRDRLGSLAPFAPGGPGAANGLGSLANVLGLLAHEGLDRDGSPVTIPDLSDRVLRSSLTVDGAYGVPGRPRFAPMTRADADDAHLDGLAHIVGFFALPAMGLRPERVARAHPRARAILEFARSYRPPPFPGPVDRELAAAGASVYQERCASCHGDYSPGVDSVRLLRFPNRLVAGDEIGTDDRRWRAARPELIAAFRRFRFARTLDVAPTGGYVATPLTGVWATAPYLHNGSVPTLWHLLHPEARPARFEVGGHRLDFARVGIDGVACDDGVYRYPSGYEPWSRPTVFDTTRPGLSNRGHEIQLEGLTEPEKEALLEYMKVL